MSHFVLEVEREIKFIDSNGFLSGIVLQSSGQESLREEETREPVDLWSSVFDPLQEEIDSGVAIYDPRT